MKHDCANCINKEFIGTKYEDSLCWQCKLEHAKEELYTEFKNTNLYKIIVALADKLGDLFKRRPNGS